MAICSRSCVHEDLICNRPIQLGWFGQPIFTVNERFIDGETILDIPGGRVENDANTNAAANQGLWAEAIWIPSIWFTDERVRWEAVDDTTARLILPNAADEEMFEIRFDAETGLISLTGLIPRGLPRDCGLQPILRSLLRSSSFSELTTLRYQNPDSPERTRWSSHVIEWQEFNGVMIPSLADLQWGTDKPWVKWQIENVYYNIDVSGRMSQFGGSYED